MINQQLFDYIKQQLAQGVTKEVINNNLLSQGWQQGDVNEAFSTAESQNISINMTYPEGPKRIYRWYLKMVIIYEISLFLASLLSIILLSIIPGFLYVVAPIVGLLSMMYSVFNLVMFFIIIAKKIERVALWIPGLILSLDMVIRLLSLLTIPAASLIANIAIPIVVLIIAIKLFKRK